MHFWVKGIIYYVHIKNHAPLQGEIVQTDAYQTATAVKEKKKQESKMISMLSNQNLKKSNSCY